MEFCACNGTILNTGAPSKQRVVASGIGLIAVRMKADDGTLNEVLATQTVDQAYIDARINDEDESKRWFPIGRFQNEEDTRADPITESFTDGSSIITQQGVRSYVGWLINYAPAYLKALESFKCFDFGLFIIDSCGALTGSVSKDGLALRPIRVNSNSWEPRYVKATPTLSAKIQLSFEFSQLERDKDLRVISETEILADLIDVEGLLPLSASVSTISATGFVAALTVAFDIFLDASKEVVPSWIAADFQLINLSTNSTVVISSVTEAPEGTYTFVIPSQTTGQTLRLTNVKTSGAKPGFFLEQDITIP